MSETSTLQATADRVRAAHRRAVKLWNEDRRAAIHKRNLAGIVLVRRYEADPAETWDKMDVSAISGDQEILPGAPVDDTLPAMSKAQAEQLVDQHTETLRTILEQHAKALDERRDGVSKMLLGQVGDRPLAPAEIAKLTGLTQQQVAADLKARRRSPQGLAEMLGVQTSDVEHVIAQARAEGMELPDHAADLFDAAAFRSWWEEHRFGWLPAYTLAETIEVSREDMEPAVAVAEEAGALPGDADLPEHDEVEHVRALDPSAFRTWWTARIMAIAEEIGDLPEHEGAGEERRFEPGAFRTWWTARMREQADIAEGWAGVTALAYHFRVPLMPLLQVLSSVKNTRSLPEHRQSSRGRRAYKVDTFHQWMIKRGRLPANDMQERTLGELAEQLGEAEHIVRGWVREAEERGIELPRHRQGPRWRLYDQQAFVAWWEESRARTRNSELASAAEMARLLEVPEADMVAGLAAADEHGLVLPPHVEHDGERMFEVAAYRSWWPAWQAALAAGELRFAAVAELAGELGLPREKVKRQIKNALERKKAVLPPHRVSDRGHRLFEVTAYRAMRADMDS
ncbi:hypothetical protein ACIHFD_49480 [Nonomuraea sp. NPDC051941]|uniref:hypothetical protein n=1 Tax=Nonomuraea sp. NPDC051941 TaxID=3364373 RepID=UPI0037C79CCC